MVPAVVLAAVLVAGCGSSGGSGAARPATGSTGASSRTPVPALLANVPQPVITIAYLLQDELTRLGYPTGPIDRDFAARVTKSLEQFQAAHGLPRTGAFDQATAVALRAASGRTDPTIVRGLQSVLTELALYSGPIDGNFGPETVAGVEKVQRAADLPATGRVDAATLVAIVRAWEKGTLPERPQPAAPAGPAVLNIGDSGPQVVALQQRLATLGYRPGDPDGRFGAATQSAVVAFEKHEGLTRDGAVGPAVQERLKHPTGAGPRSLAPQPHIEVDLDRQIAFVVLPAGVTVLDVSTGSGQTYVTPGTTARQVAYTPVGTFSVYRAVGDLVTAPLGTLYKPLYFKEGWAMHGEPIVPPYPGSHGCVRTHDWDQDWLFPQIPVGTRIDIYGTNPGGNDQSGGQAGY